MKVWNTDTLMQGKNQISIIVRTHFNFNILLRDIIEISFGNRRQRREREIANLANGINFQYTSPFMSDSQSLVKQDSESRPEGY